MEPALFEEFAREFIAEVNKSRSEASSIKAPCSASWNA
jgi:hypothetical protein